MARTWLRWEIYCFKARLLYLKTLSQLISITEECSKLSVCFQYFYENFLPKHDFGILMNEKSFLLPVENEKLQLHSPASVCIIEFVHHELVLLSTFCKKNTQSYNIPLKSKGQSTTLIYWTLWPKTRLTAWLKFSYVGAEIESGSSLIKTKKRRFHVTWRWLALLSSWHSWQPPYLLRDQSNYNSSVISAVQPSLALCHTTLAEMKNWSHSGFVTVKLIIVNLILMLQE